MTNATTKPLPSKAQKAREKAITFRFFRGRSGEEIQRKFLALEKRLDADNRSEVLRRCIEAAYTMYLDPGTIVFSDISPEDMELTLKTFRTMAQMGITDISKALVAMCKILLDSIERDRANNPESLLPEPLSLEPALKNE